MKNLNYYSTPAIHYSAETRKEFREDFARRKAEFYADALAKLKLTDNPKSKLLVNLVEEYTSGESYAVKYDTLDSFAELIG